MNTWSTTSRVGAAGGTPVKRQAPLVWGPGREKARAAATPAPSGPVGLTGTVAKASLRERWEGGRRGSCLQAACRDSARMEKAPKEPGANAGVRPPTRGRARVVCPLRGWEGGEDHFVPVVLLGSPARCPHPAAGPPPRGGPPPPLGHPPAAEATALGQRCRSKRPSAFQNNSAVPGSPSARLPLPIQGPPGPKASPEGRAAATSPTRMSKSSHDDRSSR